MLDTFTLLSEEVSVPVVNSASEVAKIAPQYFLGRGGSLGSSSRFVQNSSLSPFGLTTSIYHGE